MSNIHSFSFYMGEALKEGNKQKSNFGREYINPFTNDVLIDETAKIEIISAVSQKLSVLNQVESQWQTDKELNKGTCEYKITVKHKYDAANIIMDDEIYPFSEDKKLYQVNGEWVKASCGGENILEEWEAKKSDECLMIDNPEEEKIVKVCPDASLFEVVSHQNKNTKNWKVTVKNIETNETQTDVYPFNLEGSLYQLESGEWVLASCGGTTISDSWEGQKSNEFFRLDSDENEKILKKYEIMPRHTTFSMTAYVYPTFYGYLRSFDCDSAGNCTHTNLPKYKGCKEAFKQAAEVHAVQMQKVDQYLNSKINEAKELYGEDAFTVVYPPNENRHCDNSICNVYVWHCHATYSVNLFKN